MEVFVSRPVFPGEEFPSLSWPTAGGGTLDLSSKAGWRMLVVYRGRHCPLCGRYLDELQQLLAECEQAGVFVAALSADPKERAEAQVAERGWAFPVGYDLGAEDMRRLGLFVSDPRSPEETDRAFAEPGLFVLNPGGKLQIVDVSNAPFARPDLRALLQGIKFVAQNNYPIRGTA